MSNPKNKQLSEQLEPLSGVLQKSESDAAVQACNDWLRMGPGRNLRELVDEYKLQSTRNRRFKPPTLDYGTLRTWSSKFNWAERATEYDVNFDALKNEERAKVFANELVNDFGRIRKLVALAAFLEGQLYEYSESEPDEEGNKIIRFHNVWNPDVKSIGGGEFAERVDIERFNSAIISEYRAILADIAKEVGGRIEKKELTGANGGALTIKVVYDDTLPNGDKLK